VKQFVYAGLGMVAFTGALIGFLAWVGAFSDHGPKPVPLQALPANPPQVQQPAVSTPPVQPPVVVPPQPQQPTPAPAIQVQQSPKVTVIDAVAEPESQADLEAEAAEYFRQATQVETVSKQTPVAAPEPEADDQTSAKESVSEKETEDTPAETEALLKSGYVNLPMETVRTYIARPELTLVRVSASWCGPCLKSHGPLYEYAGNGGLAFHVDADQNAEFVKEHQVGGLPTYLLFRGGTLVGRHSGALFSLGDLNAMISRKDVSLAQN